MSSSLGEKGFDQISLSVFRIETRWSAGFAVGTGFVVGRMRDSQKLVIATAKHVLDFPQNETVWWKVQQFDEHGGVARELTFGTDPQKKGDVPYRTHNELDIGLCILPRLDAQKRPFARDGEQPVRVIDPDFGVTAGTRIAWAGFPGVVEHALGSPQLCYFEGVVSAMVNRDERQVYVVDGHAAPGVSGGPVWQWSVERDRLEVVGVVCNYQPLGAGLPGFCFFEPINPLMDYLDYWQRQEKGDVLVTCCRD